MTLPYKNTVKNGKINKNFRLSCLWGVFRTYSLSLSREQVFLAQKKQNLLIGSGFLYIIPFQGTFEGVKLFKLRIDFRNFIV